MCIRINCHWLEIIATSDNFILKLIYTLIAALNNSVFSPFLKLSSVSHCMRWTGREFHKCGAHEENARSITIHLQVHHLLLQQMEIRGLQTGHAANGERSWCGSHDQIFPVYMLSWVHNSEYIAASELWNQAVHPAVHWDCLMWRWQVHGCIRVAAESLFRYFLMQVILRRCV